MSTSDGIQLCRFYLPGQGARLGQVVAGSVVDLTASRRPEYAALSLLLRASVATPIQALLQRVSGSALPTYAYADLDRPPSAGVPHLLPPVDRQEVWAAGVTYAWSREARVREARTKDVYVRVYQAERPELFFKSTAEKVVGPHDWVGLRGDSHWNVPEPELALVLNPALQVVGYTIGNDVSSRDIEGENPLYLPQAKVYRHSCALGPVIMLAEPAAPGVIPLAIYLTVRRAIAGQPDAIAFQGETSTAHMHRDPHELAAYLGRYNDFPDGAVLLTGTGIVPGDDFSLQDGDKVLIEIEGIGILRNPVRQM
jgi:2-dehydro-3-deoxy-D-arabinonate dehydratase